MNANEKRVKKKGARLMDRLTERDEYENADIIGVNSSELQGNLDFEDLNKVTDALNLLAAYEDTGLKPEEIASLRAKLKEANEQIEWDNDLVHKLEAESDKAVADLKEALTSNSDETLCKYCKNYFECEGEKCPEFISGVGDAEGKYPTWKWSCMDFDYGECAMLENTPCHACHDNAYDGFEWRGVAE